METPESNNNTQDEQVVDGIIDLNGKWQPGLDAAEIGKDGFTTLQNYRYATRGIEGVLGYSKINTTALTVTTAVKILSGIHFRTNYSQATYVLIHGENTAGASYVYQNQTAIPSAGDFVATALHTDATSAGLGRFSPGPLGNMAYCNGKESMIWAGNEMRCAGFCAITTQAANSYTDIEFAAGPPGTITTDGAVNFVTQGYKPGMRINITACSIAGNIKIVTLKTVSATVLTVVETLTAGGAGTPRVGTATIQPIVRAGSYTNPIDYTDAVNNSLDTEGNIVQIGGGIDAFAVLMLHMDGEDGATTFTDNSLSGRTVTAKNSAQIDTAQKKFGVSSGMFERGTADYITVPDSADWAMGTGKFTIDFWVRLESLQTAATQYFAGQYVDSTHFWYLSLFENDTLTFLLKDATTVHNMQKSWTPVVDTWYHVALVRGWSGDTTLWAMTINGTQIGTTMGDSGSWRDFASVLYIAEGSAGSGHSLDGWLDEFRITKGAARWTSNFTPSSAPYRLDQLQWINLSTRPLKGIKAYIKNANDQTSSLTGKTWNGSGFADLANLVDNTASGGVSLAQDGTITFGDTDDTAVPFHFENMYLYAYLFELSAGEADIKQVTLNADFQSIKDVWDGVYRTLIQVQMWDNSATTYLDWTLELATESTLSSPIGANLGQMQAADYLIFMSDDRLTAILLQMIATKANTNDAVPTVYYWAGTQYVAVGPINDGTIANATNWKSLGQSGLISWESPGEYEEVKQTLFGITGYAYKIQWSAALSGAAVADVIVDTIVGVPAQRTVRPFKFPAIYQDMLMLCGFTEGNEGNRVDYCMPGAPDVWNGEQSSNHGTQSLFFGGKENLTCGVQIYNRFGSNIYSLFLGLKNNEIYILSGTSPANFQQFTTSRTVGCPAPLTLAVAELGFEVSEDSTRNIALWLSYAGPMMYDAAVIIPIPGVENYFDPKNSEYINLAAIATSCGWYDSTYQEYNLQIPTGAATVPNVWLVYSFRKKAFYTKHPNTEAFLRCGFPVEDSTGGRYIYGGRDDGYMMRLENGTTWNGVGIIQTFETGDFVPADNIWHKTIMRRLKLVAKRITESTTIVLTHYVDTASSGTTAMTYNVSTGTVRVVRNTVNANLLAWMHRIKGTITTSTTKGFKPMAIGYQYRVEREDT